jgi:hypothetical protein
MKTPTRNEGENTVLSRFFRWKVNKGLLSLFIPKDYCPCLFHGGGIGRMRKMRDCGRARLPPSFFAAVLVPFLRTYGCLPE